MLAALLVALVSAVPALPPPRPAAIATIPDEPDAVILPHSGPTLQSLAADLDADGAPELVRLVGGDADSVVAEAWRESDEAWTALGELVVVPEQPSGDRADVDYIGRPVRLLLRHVDGDDRVTLVRQPRFAEPGTGAEDCCLILDDLVVRGGSLALTRIAEPAASVDSIFAIDLDGDGTEELVTARSLPPLADISYPTDARVYRWDGRAFAEPVTTELPVGSGDTPFILGDSDGLPGNELGIISSVGRPALFRIAIEDDDLLRVEGAGMAVTSARAVPIEDGRGIVVAGPVLGLAVMSWPAGTEPEAPIGSLPLDDARILGLIERSGARQLVVAGSGSGSAAVQVLDLPDLTRSGAESAPTPAALTLDGGPVAPYAGVLPGGGPAGEPAMIAAGRLLGTRDLSATLAGAQPIGLVGRDRAWLAIQHGPMPFGPLDPAGGRLDAPYRGVNASVTLAPVATALTREVDAALLEPEVRSAARLERGVLAVVDDGFVAVVRAPAGSRVYVAAPDSSALGPGLIVPAGGELEVALPTPVEASGARAALTVVTPAGHGYLASWDVLVLADSPPLGATTNTPVGSATVEVTGSTAAYATVTVSGEPVTVDAGGWFATTVMLPPWPTEVVVVAVDPLGNDTRLLLTGIGLFDYRSLPWIPISGVLLAVVAAILFLRVPRTRPAPRIAAEEGTVEELEPD